MQSLALALPVATKLFNHLFDLMSRGCCTKHVYGLIERLKTNALISGIALRGGLLALVLEKKELGLGGVAGK